MATKRQLVDDIIINKDKILGDIYDFYQLSIIYLITFKI